MKTRNDEDFAYLSKHQIKIIKKICDILPTFRNKFNIENHMKILQNLGISLEYMNELFGDHIKFFDMAYCINPPNKISIIKEFEKIKKNLGKVPSKENIEKYSNIPLSEYETAFGSLELFFERLNYDPWIHVNKKIVNGIHNNDHELEHNEKRYMQIEQDKKRIELEQIRLKNMYNQLNEESKQLKQKSDKLNENKINHIENKQNNSNQRQTMQVNPNEKYKTISKFPMPNSHKISSEPNVVYEDEELDGGSYYDLLNREHDKIDEQKECPKCGISFHFNIDALDEHIRNGHGHSTKILTDGDIYNNKILKLIFEKGPIIASKIISVYPDANLAILERRDKIIWDKINKGWILTENCKKLF